MDDNKDGQEEEVQIELPGNAPLIQISHPNIPQNADADGVENPVFDMEEEEEAALQGQRARASSTVSTSGNPFVHLKRGSVQVGVTIQAAQSPTNDTDEVADHLEDGTKSERPSLIVPSSLGKSDHIHLRNVRHG